MSRLSSMRGGRLYPWASAFAATLGLLAFGWSPTGVLLLFWIETVARVLVPFLVALTLIAVRREGFAAGAVLLFVMAILCAFLAGQAFVIAVLGLFEIGAITDLHATTLTVPLYEPLVAILREPSFLATAAGVVALTVFEFFPQLVPGAGSRPTPRAQNGLGGLFTRILAGQFALVAGGGVIILTQLPSAAALVLVAVKLWLDLRAASKQEDAGPAST